LQLPDDIIPREETDPVTDSIEESVPRAASMAGPDSRGVQKLLAASLWTAVGIMLSVLGIDWMIVGFHWWALLLAVPMIALGFIKGRFILDGMAKRNVIRIHERGPAAPWWGFYPLRTWVLVAVMMGTGIILRVVIPDLFFHFHAPDIYFAYIGLVYLAVGVALIHASRTWWRALLERAP
jgi:hypothetical protein